MPTVQTYGGQKIGTAPLPGVRGTAAETPTSEGAGVFEAKARTNQTIAGVTGALANQGIAIYSEEVRKQKREADETALLDAENKLITWQQRRLYDPNNGALAVKGKDAMPLPETVGSEFKDVAGQIQSTLATPDQKRAFDKVTASHALNLDLTLRRHVFGEMQNYQAGTLKAYIDNNTNDAIANANDPTHVGQNLQKITDAIRQSAPRLGLGPDEQQAAISAAQTGVHTGVINRLLDNEQDKAAQVYYDETKDQISGDARGRIEKALEAGNLRGEGQKQADAIIGAGGSLSEQLDKLKAIDDPKLRDEVRTRIEHNAAIKDRSDREQEAAILREVYDTIDRTGDVTKIKRSIWAGMSGSERSAARSYADSITRGVKVETDIPTYYGLMQKAAHTPEDFAVENLLKYKSKLGDTEFKQLANMQDSIIKGDKAASDKDLGGFRTHEQIVNDSLTQYGIDPKAKDGTPEAKSIAQLRRMLDESVSAQEQLTGKKASNLDIQSAADKILSTSARVPGSWWQFWAQKDKAIINMTIADVPATEKTAIEDALKRSGRSVSDATVLDLYLQSLARKK